MKEAAGDNLDKEEKKRKKKHVSCFSTKRQFTCVSLVNRRIDASALFLQHSHCWLLLEL